VMNVLAHACVSCILGGLVFREARLPEGFPVGGNATE